MGLNTKGVLTFLLISFGLAWGAVFVTHLALDVTLNNPLAQVPMAFSPAIAAVAVRRWVTREGFRDAGLRPRVGTAWFYYLLAWIGPVLVLAATVGLAAALGLYRPSSPGEVIHGMDLPGPAWLLLALAAPVALLAAFWGEEFGWRSYLQQRVNRKPVPAALITGLVWAVWHYPLIFMDYTAYTNPFLGIVTWTPLLMSQAVILAWLFLRSGTVWVACLAHAGNNLVIGTFSHPLLVEEAGISPATIDLLTLVPFAAVCAWILYTGRLRPAAESTPDTLRRINAV